MKIIKLFTALTIIVLLSVDLSKAENIIKQVPVDNQQVQLSFAPLVKKSAPAVVNIYSTRKIKVREISPFFSDPLFKHFLGENFSNSISEQQENSLGSGVIVKSNGLIITSNHVIAKSDAITVVLADRTQFEAKVLIADEKTDLALLQINVGKRALPFIELMDSDKLEVGDIVLAIGNPFGVGQTVTSGIVSALARTNVGVSDYQFFIQTDAAINPGNSGGALLTTNGKLAGINTAIYTKSGGSNGVGFAIPANMVATIIKNNGNETGHIVRPWLGIAAGTINQEIANSLNLPKPIGVVVRQLYPNGPAQSAGIKVGDVILAVDDIIIIDDNELNFRVATHEIGTHAKFKIFRNGEELLFNVAMKAPIESPARDLRILRGHSPLTGAAIANISPYICDILGLSIENVEKGVVIMEVASDAIAKRVGFQEKDIIAAVNGVNVVSTKQLENILMKEALSYKVTIKRGNRLINIILNGKF